MTNEMTGPKIIRSYSDAYEFVEFLRQFEHIKVQGMNITTIGETWNRPHVDYFYPAWKEHKIVWFRNEILDEYDIDHPAYTETVIIDVLYCWKNRAMLNDWIRTYKDEYDRIASIHNWNAI